MAEDVAIDGDILYSRLRRMYDTWITTRSEHGDCDALYLPCGEAPGDDDDNFQKFVIAQLWMFGYILANTVVVIGEKEIVFISAKKKIQMLQTALNITADEVPVFEHVYKDGKTARMNVAVKFAVRNKNDNFAENSKLIVDTIKKSFKGLKYGVFKNNKNNNIRGEMIDVIKKYLDEAKLVDVEIKKLMSALIAVKEPGEIECVMKAAQLSCAVLSKYFVTRMEDIINKDTTVSMIRLANECETKFTDPRSVDVDLAEDKCESAFPPVIQSGSQPYDLTSFTTPEKGNLSFDTIIVAMGGRYSSYCANVGRTYFVNPSKELKALYGTLLSLQSHLVSMCKPGVTNQGLYNAALSWLDSHKTAGIETWESHLAEFLGFGIGLEASENYLSVKKNPVNVVELKSNMVLSLMVAFRNLPGGATNKPVMWVVDTVVVTPDGGRVLTDSVKTSEDEVMYQLDDVKPKKKEAKPKAEKKEKPKKEKASKKSKKEEDDFIDDEGDEESYDEGLSDEEEPEEVKPKKHKEKSEHKTERMVVEVDVNAPRALRARQNVAEAKEIEADRKKHQKDLSGQLNEQAKQRLLHKGDEDVQVNAAEWTPTDAYGAIADYPDLKPNQIFLDARKEVVFLPINGQQVPFQLSFIKNVTKTDVGGWCELRILFHSPGLGAAALKNYPPALKFPNSTFVRELTYRSPNVLLFTELQKKLLEMLKRSRARVREEKEDRKTFDFGDLQLLKSEKPPRLTDVFVRPYTRKARSVGIIEAHKNGLRFTCAKTGDQIDVMYNNIQRAFFQPSSLTDPLAILHFHLRSPIKIGKKATDDVQFAVAVFDLSEDINKGRGHGTDRDEHEAEERQRQFINQINNHFHTFMDKLKDVRQKYKTDADAEYNFEFQTLTRTLAFMGNPARSSILLYPTEDALVSVEDSPFFVLELKDVELVHFERVQHGLKSFDMVFILKDYKKPPVHINNCQVEDLHDIQEWLDECNIKFYEGPANLNWTAIMKQITEDLEAFFADGGWEFLNADEENEGDDEDDEEDYQGEAEAESEESDESDDEYGSDEEGEEESSEGEEESEVSEGKDWSDLEAEAAEDDRRALKRDLEEEQEEKAAKKSRKGK